MAGLVSIAHLEHEMGLLQPLQQPLSLLLLFRLLQMFGIAQTYLCVFYELKLVERTFITKGPPLSPSQASPLFVSSGL